MRCGTCEGRVNRLVSLFAASLLALLAPHFAHGETAQEIIAAADAVRYPGHPFRLTNNLVEYVDGVPRNRSMLVVFAKLDEGTGQFNDLIRYAAPPRDQGKLVLFAGSKMWFYDPASRASVRISPQQRLLGQASNGDVLTQNYARDYKARLDGEETIEDAARQPRDCWHLDLTAASDDAVYSRIEYWVERGSHFPIKMRYYSDSGRLLKVAYYRKFDDVFGRKRPSDTILIDAVDNKHVTTMTLSDWRLQDIPDSWFQREFLPHLRVD